MPMSTCVRRLVLALTILGGLTACAMREQGAHAVGAAAVNAASSADSLAQTSWELVRWSLPDGTLAAIPHGDNGEPINLTFLAAEGQYRVAGFAGCNRYMGTYQLAGGRLDISVGGSTRMACPSAERSRLESDYLQALNQIVEFTLDHSGAPRQLSFVTQGGGVLDFVRRDDPPGQF